MMNLVEEVRAHMSDWEERQYSICTVPHVDNATTTRTPFD